MTVKIVVPTSSSLPTGSGPLVGTGRGESRADHPRLVGEARRPYLGRRAQQGGEFTEALAHCAPEDEHVRPEQPVERVEVFVDARNPPGEVEAGDGTGVRRGPFLGVHAAQLEMAELRVRKEF